MRDFNFFDAYDQQKQKRQGGPRVSYPFILILVVLAAAAWPAFNFYQQYTLNNEIDATRTQLQTDPRYPLIVVVDAKQVELEEEQQLLVDLEKAAEIIYDREVIDEQLLFTIATAMPEDTSLSSMTINGRDVQMNGVASGKPAIAELEFNLRNTGQFEQIFVPSITEDEGLWLFNLVFRVKGGEVE